MTKKETKSKKENIKEREQENTSVDFYEGNLANFTVENFIELMTYDKAVDFYSLNPLEPLGARGEAYLASYSNLYKSTVSSFKKTLEKTPNIFLKKILGDIITHKVNNMFDTIKEENEKDISEAELERMLLTMLSSGAVAFDVTPPICGDNFKLIPLSEKVIKKIEEKDPAKSRKSILQGVLQSKDGKVLTAEGAEKAILELPYMDFEYMFMYMDLFNTRFSNINWREVLKKF